MSVSESETETKGASKMEHFEVVDHGKTILKTTSFDDAKWLAESTSNLYLRTVQVFKIRPNAAREQVLIFRQ